MILQSNPAAIFPYAESSAAASWLTSENVPDLVRSLSTLCTRMRKRRGMKDAISNSHRKAHPALSFRKLA